MVVRRWARPALPDRMHGVFASAEPAHGHLESVVYSGLARHRAGDACACFVKPWLRPL
jgi:hypothetical protein